MSMSLVHLNAFPDGGPMQAMCKSKRATKSTSVEDQVTCNACFLALIAELRAHGADWRDAYHQANLDTLAAVLGEVPPRQLTIKDLQIKLDESNRLLAREITDRRIAEANVRVAHATPETVWFWEKDGDNDPESLSCPVVMPAETLREILKLKEEAYQKGIEDTLQAIPGGDTLQDCIGSPGRLSEQEREDIRDRLARNTRQALSGKSLWDTPKTEPAIFPLLTVLLNEEAMQRYEELYSKVEDTSGTRRAAFLMLAAFYDDLAAEVHSKPEKP